MRYWRKRLVRLPAMAVSALVVGLFSAGLAHAAPATSVEQAEAIAKPSVVFIQTQWDGFVTSASYHGVNILTILTHGKDYAPEYKVTTTCSGFIANPTGYVMTAAHCVDDQSMRYGGRGLIVQAAVAALAKEVPRLSSSALQGILDYGYSNWTVEGQDSGSPPDRVVGVFPTQAASGIPVTRPLQANVIDVRPFDSGDVALLKVESKTPMPALQVAPAVPQPGVQVVAMGYPGSVSDTVDAGTDPSMKDGTVSGDRTVHGVPFTEISAATSSGMSGGPVVDVQGRVVGMVSWSPGTETQAFNFMTATSSVNSILARNSVRNTLSQTDQAYRAGLADYFAGRYHEAVTKFDQVLQLEPDHAMAQQYKRLAITKYPLEKPPRPITRPPVEQPSTNSSTLLYVLIGAGVIVLGVAIGATLFLRKRRGGGAPGATDLGLPAGGGPAGAGTTLTPVMPQTPSVEAPASQLHVPPVPPSIGPTAPAGSPSTGAGSVGPPAETRAQLAHANTYCPFCGEPHDPDAHFCAACGFHFPSRQQAGGSA